MSSTPFGEDPKPGRLRRALAGRSRPPSGDLAAPDWVNGDDAVAGGEGRGAAALRRTLVYFGLATPPGSESRYGTGVSMELDAEIDELRRRVAELEGCG